MNRHFKYKPLSGPSDSIRALTLLPASWKGSRNVPACLLHQVRLSSSPHYTTLSYVWGTLSEQRVVLVNGKIARVTQNLYEALVALRLPSKGRIIWVDALCINQQDDQEKSQQVGLMSMIYQQSSSAIGWLGPAGGSSDRALDFLQDVGDPAVYCLKFGPSFLIHLWEDFFRLRTAPELSKVFNDIQEALGDSYTSIKVFAQRLLDRFIALFKSNGRAQLDIIDSLLIRPFWSRIWIFQEVSLPSQMVFLCGAKAIARSKFCAAVQAYRVFWMILQRAIVADPTFALQYTSGLHCKAAFIRPALMLSCWEPQTRIHLPLAALLSATSNKVMNPNRDGLRDLVSTRPEDKVFALLGLATDRLYFDSQGIVVDYTRSYQDVYTTVMVALLHQGHISFLSMCQTYGLRNDIPSWVPDWSLSITDMFQDVENDHITPYPAFNASEALPSSAVAIDFLRCKGKPDKMVISGCLYDTVHAKGCFPKRKNTFEVPLNEIDSWPITWLFECIRLSYLVPSAYQDFEHRLRCITRTSIGGVGVKENPPFGHVQESRFDGAVILLDRASRSPCGGRLWKDALQFLRSDTAQDIIKLHSRRTTLRDLPLESEIVAKSLGRIPFVTKKGYMGLSTEHIQKGDTVAILTRAQVPYILRPHDEGTYRLIGEAYIDGIMHGEAVHGTTSQPIQIV